MTILVSAIDLALSSLGLTRRGKIVGFVSVVLVPCLLAYRPLGGFVIGTLILVASLYLGNLAISNLGIGLTAVVEEIGQPRRLAVLATGVLAVGLVVCQP